MPLSKPKTKTAFFKLEDKTWNKLGAQMKGLPPEGWLARGTAGSWNAKDIWANIADYMIVARSRIPKMLRGATLRPFDVPRYNEKQHKRNRKMRLIIAQKRIEREREKILAYLRTLSKKDLLGNPYIYGWASFSTFNHYDEHIPDLKKIRHAIEKHEKRFK